MVQSYGTFPAPQPREGSFTVNRMLGQVVKRDLRDPKVRFRLKFVKNVLLMAMYSIALKSLSTVSHLKTSWDIVESCILVICTDIYFLNTLRQLHEYIFRDHALVRPVFEPFGTTDIISPIVYLLASHIYLALHITIGVRGWMRYHELKTLQFKGVVSKFSRSMFAILGAFSVLNAVKLIASIIYHYLKDRRPNPLSELPSPVPRYFPDHSVPRQQRQRRQERYRRLHERGRIYRVSKAAVFRALDPARYFM